MTKLTTAQAAQRLSVHPNTLKAWDKAGTLGFEVARTAGNHRRWDEQDVEHLAARLRTGWTPTPAVQTPSPTLAHPAITLEPYSSAHAIWQAIVQLSIGAGAMWLLIGPLSAFAYYNDSLIRPIIDLRMLVMGALMIYFMAMAILQIMGLNLHRRFERQILYVMGAMFGGILIPPLQWFAVALFHNASM